MPQVEARLERGPLTRRIVLAARPTNSSAARLVRIMGEVRASPSASLGRRRARGACPLLVEAAVLGAGRLSARLLLLAYLRRPAPARHIRVEMVIDGLVERILADLLVGLLIGGDRRLLLLPPAPARAADRHRRSARTWPRRREPAERRQGIADEAAAAAGDVAGQILGAHVHANCPERRPARRSAAAQGRRAQARRDAQRARDHPLRPDRAPDARTRSSALDAQLGAFRGRLTPRPDRRAGGLSRARRHRRLRAALRQALGWRVVAARLRLRRGGERR